MSTFTCKSNCEKYCNDRSSRKCHTKESWQQKLKTGLPPRWPFAREKASPLSKEERELLEKILQRLPDSFPIDELTGIYKISSAKSLSTMGTPSTYLDGQIVLYQRAFDQPGDLTHYLIHELAHHMHETKLKDKFTDYKKSLQWTSETRPGPFLRSNGRQSPEEDFADNFEAYVLDPASFEQTVPKASSWMKKNFKDQFRLRECK